MKQNDKFQILLASWPKRNRIPILVAVHEATQPAHLCVSQYFWTTVFQSSQVVLVTPCTLPLFPFFPSLLLRMHLQTCLPTSCFSFFGFIALLAESEAKSSEMSNCNAFSVAEQTTQLPSTVSAMLCSPTCCTRLQLLLPPVFLLRISILNHKNAGNWCE